MFVTWDNEEVTKYIEQMKEIYELFLIFIDNPDPNAEEDYWNLLQTADKYCIKQSKELFNHFIGILINIANDHHRQFGFFEKIERIITNYKETLLNNSTNIEIYQQFKNNKRLLLYLIKEQIIIMDAKITQLIKSKFEINGSLYSNYFLTEITKSTDKNNFQNILSHYSNSLEEYDQKRKIGENDSYICSLIRQDLVEKFIEFVNRTNLPLSSKIKQSIFETNHFLIGKEPSLIEYAAFYGSIQIFQYLYLNKVEVSSSLWLYAIHSNNSDLIRNYIESNNIKPKNNQYFEVFNEAIKCHHNEVARYIEDNLINEKMMNKTIWNNKTKYSELIFGNIFKYYNYSFFPTNHYQNYAFYYFYKYGYHTIVNLLIQSGKFNETETITTTKTFNEISNIKKSFYNISMFII